MPPLVSTGTGLAFADDSVAALANPEVVADRKRSPAEGEGGMTWMSPDTGAACLPPPPANGIVVCAVSGRYPPLKKLRKNKKWVPFEAIAGRLAQAVSVRGCLLLYKKRWLERDLNPHTWVDFGCAIQGWRGF